MNIPKELGWVSVLTLSLVSACGGEEATQPPESPPDGIQIEVGSHGYRPAQVSAEAGEEITLVFTRTTDDGCGEELIIPAVGIERELPLDEPVAVTFVPEEAGELRFSCGMDMYDGQIVVQ